MTISKLLCFVFVYSFRLFLPETGFSENGFEILGLSVLETDPYNTKGKKMLKMFYKEPLL